MNEKESRNAHATRTESALVHAQRRIEKLVPKTQDAGTRDGLLIALEILRHEARFPRP